MVNVGVVTAGGVRPGREARTVLPATVRFAVIAERDRRSADCAARQAPGRPRRFRIAEFGNQAQSAS